MAKNEWLLDSIIGSADPKPAPDAPPLAIVDTREIIWSSGKRTSGLTRALRVAETAAAIEKIFGCSLEDLAKAPPVMPPPSDSLEPPSVTFRQEPPPTPRRENLVAANPDPVARPRCECDCGMCETGGCWNCLGNPRCQFARQDLLDRQINKPDAEPVEDADEIEADFLATPQKAVRETGQMRFDRHHANLKPLTEKFLKALRRATGVRREGARSALAADRLVNSMASYCTSNLP